MKVLEQFIESKTGNQSLCEDSIFLNESFAAVIDGATSKPPSSRRENWGGWLQNLSKCPHVNSRKASSNILDSVDKSINGLCFARNA